MESPTSFSKVLFALTILISSTHGQQPQIDFDEPPHSSVRGLGYEYPRYSFPSDETKVSPRWLVVAGRHVIPGSVYRVAVQVLIRGMFNEDTPLTMRASISHNDEQIAFGKAWVQPGELSHILLQIPDTIVQGTWLLRVEGREGSSQLPVFKNVTQLTFSPQFLTILIQTSRPVYMGGQTVRFRAVMLTRELRPYEEPVDIYVLDPRGNVMRRWPSRQTGDGIVNLNFDLPEYPLLGNWTIQVQARQQVQNKTVAVELYFRPRFEVFVRLPQTFKVTDDVITGVVVANMTNWRDVFGNCSVKLQMATNNEFPIPTEFETVHSEFIYNFTGYYPFHLPMDAIARRADSLKDVVIRVYASVGDAFGWRIQHGWALSRIVQEQLKVSFLGDQPLFFRPGMPTSVHVFVSYSDGHPFDEEEFLESRMTVTFRSTKTHTIIVNGTDLQEQGGVALCTSEIPPDAKSLDVVASFASHSGLTGGATLTGIIHHSPREHHLQVETSTHNAIPGQNIVLHVRSNFFLTHINYLVVSNGLIVYSDRKAVNDVSYPSVTTFSLPASPHMSPVAKIMVWVVDPHSEIICHSIAIPVSPLGRHEAGIRWNDHKDHSGGTAEIKMLGETGASFATSSMWEETHLMDAGNDFDAARILHHMMGFHDSGQKPSIDIIPHVRRASTKSRDGYGSTVRFFPTSNAGPDAPSTFNFTEVILLTDAMIYYHPSKATDAPLCEKEKFPCLTGGCYTKEQRCDGERDCTDSSDEAGCPLNIDPLRYFRIYRISRLYRFYDPIDGDWAWKDVRGVGREIEVYAIPKRPQNWVFSMFAVGIHTGLGLIQEKIAFDSPGPMMLTLEGPPVARMWEQVGLRAGVFNYHHTVVGILVTLAQSDDYQSILVEQNGVVESYNPRRAEGTFQHVVWLKPGESIDVHIPIIFKRMGSIEVTVDGLTQMQRDGQTITIEVVPEGAGIAQHSSIILDLKSRAVVYEFLDIHLDETPVVPYTLLRRYVFGTTSAYVSVSGDIVGPAYIEERFTEGDMLGFGTIGAETSVYNFGANLWCLHYLRLTNQLKQETAYRVLTGVNVDYAALVRYQDDDGGFSNWIGSEQSVWLTAYSLKNLWLATFQDWENYIYIDNEVIRKGVEWLLQYQTQYGSFHETEYYLHPLEPKIDPRSRHSWLPKYQNVTLTAHVVIGLQYVMTSLEGDLHRRANLAKKAAVKYLEQVLPTLTDPYDLAVTTWALMKADSEEKDAAFNALDKIKRVEGDRIYWSREPILHNEIIYENSQRPYLQVKSDNVWDAHAVEATSYALLVYIKTGGIGLIQENIVRFLNSMRENDGGMISSVDSLVALEALTEYSWRARIRDITEMSIEIEHSADPNTTIEFVLDKAENLAILQSYDLTAAFGHISVIGHGSGQALVQLGYSYGVDVPAELEVPPLEAFDFKLHARFTGRNNSYITVTSCQSWINVQDSEASGLAIVSIHLPSGYHIMQDDLIEMVNTRKVRNLRWASISSSDVKFFFNYLDSDPICLTYQIERWYPVANHSRYNMAQIYDLYQPERFKQLLFEVYPLYALDICEVCGSYQCPYCPYYSDSPNFFPTFFLIVFPQFLVFLYRVLWR